MLLEDGTMVEEEETIILEPICPPIKRKNAESPSASAVKPESSSVARRRVPPSKMHVLVEDLSNGMELYPIRVWNSMNHEKPAPFEYIKTVELFEKYQRTPVICECDGACDENCICMGNPFDAKYCEIPYDDATGRLSKIPKEWLGKHRSLWECSDECPCGSECPSRSAQLGLRHRLEVYMTSKKGWGVRALREIPKGSFIAEYAGVMTVAKDDEDWSDNNWYSFDIMTEDGASNFFIDATKKGNIGRFFNHSCEPNMLAFHVFYDDNNPVFGMHICFFCTKDIKEGEELTFDYGNDYWEANRQKEIGCECGSTYCNFRLRKSKKAKKAKLNYTKAEEILLDTPHIKTELGGESQKTFALC